MYNVCTLFDISWQFSIATCTLKSNDSIHWCCGSLEVLCVSFLRYIHNCSCVIHTCTSQSIITCSTLCSNRFLQSHMHSPNPHIRTCTCRWHTHILVHIHTCAYIHVGGSSLCVFENDYHQLEHVVCSQCVCLYTARTYCMYLYTGCNSFAMWPVYSRNKGICI